MKILKEWNVSAPEEMRVIAKWAIEEVSKAQKQNSNIAKSAVIGLYGDLGAGKTTFSQILARELGVSENVTSPTFVIQKIYSLALPSGIPGSIFDTLVHIDAYRLNSPQELEKLGWNDLLTEQKTLILIEWPENVAQIIPSDHIQLRFLAENEHNRRVTATYIIYSM